MYKLDLEKAEEPEIKLSTPLPSLLVSNLSCDLEVFPFTISVEANTFKWQEPLNLGCNL